MHNLKGRLASRGQARTNFERNAAKSAFAPSLSGSQPCHLHGTFDRNLSYSKVNNCAPKIEKTLKIAFFQILY